MEKPMRKQYYNPNSPYLLDRKLRRAQHAVREVELRRDIARVTQQIALLERMKTIYPINNRDTPLD
jgi:hypothetical protein